MGALATNGAVTTISTSISSTATQIVLAGGTGELFPAAVEGKTWFFGTLYDDNNNVEVVKVTVRSGDTLTVLRGQDGTTARKFDAGDGFDLRPTAALFNDKVSEDELASTKTELKTDYTAADSALQKTMQRQIDATNSTVTSLTTTVTSNNTTVTENYYTKTDADGRYLKLTGGTVSGDLAVTGAQTVNGAVTMRSTLSVSGEANFSGAVRANSFRSTSDRRLKKDIKSLDEVECLEKALSLKPVSYRWNGSMDDKRTRLGLIAQDVQKVVPEAVAEGYKGVLSIDYSCLTATLLGAVKAMQAEIDQLRRELEEK